MDGEDVQDSPFLLAVLKVGLCFALCPALLRVFRCIQSVPCVPFASPRAHDMIMSVFCIALCPS